MRKQFPALKSMMLLLYIIIIFCACKNDSATEPPTAVLDGMFNAMKNGNIDSMKNFITTADVAMLEAAEAIMTQANPEGVQKIKARMLAGMKENIKNVSYNFKNEKIDGNHATVETEIIHKVPDSLGGEKRTTHSFELVKENNVWKIALSKPGNDMFNSMKGNMGRQKADLKDGVEILQKMHPDSLKKLIGKGVQAIDSMDKKKKQQ